MLTYLTRRNFLQIGGLAVGGLTLPQLLQAQTNPRSSQKAVIMVFLSGGPPHQDMVDLKPEAPEDVRGEFKPIRTRVVRAASALARPRSSSAAGRSS